MKMIKKINDHTFLFQNRKSGLVWVLNCITKKFHCCHPRISKNEDVSSVSNWDRNDKIVRIRKYKYNLDKYQFNNRNIYDLVAIDNCMCQTCVKRREDYELAVAAYDDAIDFRDDFEKVSACYERMTALKCPSSI